ncbi:glycosyltransferase [Bacillus mycoides]|uniref:glycosyltransferase n=1 Tax=Bacillus mycoides TaxID=1405 RepID=UPI001C024FA9|nr:glycosyltransferase [Bacillus mycoides]QWG51640.1 glycosyltransferase [Bacillus mycoides]QWG57250.1 glycosyltransferase [Bacillus mycoides]QWG74954.1 glycosyltransferase [Bacillus mycoides]QWH24271.1 glycosyltransferase [Bacillus mycoides]QWH35443.1 glycosyltransferase [Bacillus mycoides]
MKKNLLFVMPSLSAGGGEKSLINLLSQIDYTSYNVDLFLFNKNGTFMKSIPKGVNVLDFSNDYKVFRRKLFYSTMFFLKNGKFSLAYSRLMFTIRNRMLKDVKNSEQYTWKYMRESFDTLEKEYDVAIGYLEKSPIYFVVDKVKAKKRIGWIHTNYFNSGMDYRFDYPYFRKLNNIITVSEECVKSLENSFVDLKQKLKVIYNIVSPKVIQNLSNDKTLKDSIFDKSYINIITTARLSHEKGIDLAINSCKLLVNRGHKVRWYVLGNGKEKSALERLIEKNNLTDNFKLLGVRENPYPYIKKADIYVQPSRYEGKSIAIDEAKILNKPIIVTNFSTAKDQIENKIDGLIVDMEPRDIANGVEKLIKDIGLKHKLVNNLSKKKFGTEEEIYKLYEIL